MTWWKNHPIRLVQTNIREIDMQNLPVRKIIQDLKEFHANTLIFNAAGLVANYRTELEYHFINPYLSGETLAELTAACHHEGIRVIGRGDFSRIRRCIWEKHPEWAYISPDDRINEYHGDINVCFMSWYQQEYAFRIMEEMLQKLDLDGIFLNNTEFMSGFDYRNGWMGRCHCPSCRKAFYERFQEEIPEEGDLDSPAAQKYRRFQAEAVEAYRQKLLALKRMKPDICITMIDLEPCEAGTHHHSSGNPLDNSPYMALSGAKLAAASYPKSFRRTTTIDFVDLTYRHAAVSPWMQQLRVWESISNGGNADYYVIGRLDTQPDRSAHAAVKEAFRYFASQEEEYREVKPFAEILLVKSRRRLDEVLSSSGKDDPAEYMGWLRILVEKHFAFNCVYDSALSRICFEDYKAVILPDIGLLSEEILSKLVSYVGSGGILIASGHSGLNAGSDFRRCLGIKKIDGIDCEFSSAYFKIDPKDGFRHFHNRDVVMVSKRYIHAEFSAETEKLGSFIPPHPFAPAESCYYTVVTDEPAAAVRHSGKGKAVWLPWLPGSEYASAPYYMGQNEFLEDLLTNILGIAPLCEGLHPTVELSLLRQPEGSFLLHLINGSGCFDKSYFKPIKIERLHICLRLEQEPLRVTDLCAQQSYPFHWENEKLFLDLQNLEAFCCFKIEFHEKE